MSKLKRFNKSNKKNIIPLVALCLVVAVISATISYAVYQKEDEVAFINAKVRWPLSNEVSYSTTYNTNVTNVEEALNDLYGKLGS